MKKAVILLGSNIDPAQNLRRAVDMLRLVSSNARCSSIWRTRAVGSAGPDFLNMAVEIETDLEIDALKFGVLRPIESKLGRVRTTDKNAPRTIDLDIVLSGDDVIDDEVWKLAHVAVPVAELVPDLRHPSNGERLRDTAARLQVQYGAEQIMG